MLLRVPARSMNCSALATRSRLTRYSYLRRRCACASPAGYHVPLRWNWQPEFPSAAITWSISRCAWGGGAAPTPADASSASHDRRRRRRATTFTASLQARQPRPDDACPDRVSAAVHVQLVLDEQFLA